MNFHRILLITVVILFIPLIAMQFTDEITWTLIDFIIAGLLLFSAGFSYEFATKKVKKPKHKIAIGIAIALILIFIWAELSVGIFTNLGS